MEHALRIGGEICDSNFVRYTGYQEDNGCIKEYFSQRTVDIISHKVTELLMGVDPQNRPIIVPDETIGSVMSEIQFSYRPPTGDIWSRYNIPSDEPTNLVQNMIDQCINLIVTDVRVNLETIENNSKLSIWTTVLGEGINDHGLRSHPQIKTREKRPQPFLFNMNY
jgi:hypothetical protein